MKSLRTAFGIITSSLALSFSAAAALSCPCSEVSVPEKPNAFTIEEGLKYMKTPEYQKEFNDAIASAKKACEKHKGEKDLAIVSDIDETCLDNSAYFSAHPQAGWNEWTNWLDSEKDTPLKPTAEFLSWARKNGFAIFFITGRNESERRSTINNLIGAGISYDGLYMRPDNDATPAEVMKTNYRKQIEGMGFKIIVSIGDQYSDLAGGHAEDCEKLPNKMYFIK